MIALQTQNKTLGHAPGIPEIFDQHVSHRKWPFLIVDREMAKMATGGFGGGSITGERRRWGEVKPPMVRVYYLYHT